VTQTIYTMCSHSCRIMNKNVVNASVNSLICGETSFKENITFLYKTAQTLIWENSGVYVCVHMYVVIYIVKYASMYEYVNMCVLCIMYTHTHTQIQILRA